MLIVLTLIASLASSSGEAPVLVLRGGAADFVESASLLDELRARLPSLTITTELESDRSASYVLSYQMAAGAGDSSTSALRLHFQSVDGELLMDRDLPAVRGDVTTARRIAVLVEGLVRRRTDEVAALLAKQGARSVSGNEPSLRVIMSGGMTVAGLPTAGEAGVGLFLGGSLTSWRWVWPHLELDFQSIGAASDSGLSLTLHEATAAGMLMIPVYRGEASILLGAGLGAVAALAQLDERDRQLDDLRWSGMARVEASVTWPATRTVAIVLGIRADVMSVYPDYLVRGKYLLNRGSTKFLGLVGLRQRFSAD